MIITFESNKADWEWLLKEMLQYSFDRSLLIMLDEFGAKTEPLVCMWGQRTFEIIDADKFFLKKMELRP